MRLWMCCRKLYDTICTCRSAISELARSSSLVKSRAPAPVSAAPAVQAKTVPTTRLVFCALGDLQAVDYCAARAW